MLDPVPLLMIRLALALLFAIAAIQKLRAPALFVEAVREYRLLPERMAAPAAAGLIALELALAGGVIAGLEIAVAAMAALLLLYAVAIAINLGRGRREIDCGCGGPGASRPLSAWLVVRNLALATLACVALLPASTRELGYLDVFAIGAALATLTALYGAAETLAATAPRLKALRNG